MANVPIYTEQGGKRMVIGDGATLVIEGDLEVGGGGEITPGPDSITTAMIQDDAVTTAKIEDQGVTFAKTLASISNEITGDGMGQEYAHMLGVVPAAVLVVPSSNTGLMDAEFEIAYVTDAANVTVTATAGLKYYVMAWG